MSKIKQEQLTISVKLNKVKVGSVDNNQSDTSDSPIYRVENLYYQYLRDLKLGNLNDTTDFCAAFMTF